MKTRFRHCFPALLCILLLSGCTALRTEFYREETKYLYEIGCQSYKQGDYDRARLSFNQVIDVDPVYGPAYAALGNLAMIEENYDQAFALYTQAISCAPELEKDILPLLLSSEAHRQREPLVKAGVRLADLYRLFMAGEIEKAETILHLNLPLELIASDAGSLTPGQFQELRHLSEELARNHSLPPRVSLLAAYIIFYAETDDNLVIELLSSPQPDSHQQLRQEAYILLGRTLERVGRKNSAVDAYLAAVAQGKPLTEVAHYLARLYRTDIAAIVPAPPPQIQTAEATTDTIEFQPLDFPQWPANQPPATTGQIPSQPGVKQMRQNFDSE